MRRKNYTYLIYRMAIADFKLRYSSSVLGYLWSFLNPLLMFGVLYLVFSVFVRWEIPNYALYLLIGIITWNFFSETTLDSMFALLNKRSLITKIRFPKKIIIISVISMTSLTLIINFFIFFMFFIFSSVQAAWTLMLVPLYLFELILVSLGTAFFLSAFYIQYRDFQHLWRVFLQLGFWLTPIVYPITMVPEKYLFLVMLNPMARIIQGMRDSIIYGTSAEPVQQLLTLIFSALIFIIGIYIFKKREVKFAEYV